MKKIFYLHIFVFCTTVANAQWSLSFQTFQNQIVKVMSSPNDSVCWFITNMDSLYKTNDGGQNWTKLPPSNISFNPYGLFVLNADTAFKASNGDLFKTTNGGISWFSVFTGGVAQPPVVWMKNNLEGVLSHGGLIYKTTDGGNTWSSSTITQPSSAIINSSGKGTLWVKGDTIWVLLTTSGVSYSTDFGASWNLPANLGLSHNTYGNISFSNTSFGIATLHNSSTIYTTTDGANTWLPSINSLGANQDVLAINSDLWFIPNPADHFYIKYSADSGVTWIQQLFDPAGFEQLEKSKIGHTIWAGTDQGKIYVNTTQVTTNLSATIHDKFSVNISPNPFAVHTIITFQENKKRSIKVLNILGEEIKTITSLEYSCVIERGEMKSGMYFLLIADENNNVVKKKIIIN